MISQFSVSSLRLPYLKYSVIFASIPLLAIIIKKIKVSDQLFHPSSRLLSHSNAFHTLSGKVIYIDGYILNFGCLFAQLFIVAIVVDLPFQLPYLFFKLAGSISKSFCSFIISSV